MGQINAKILADSINPFGDRLTSFEITVPKWLLQEINTHRALSRSFASSRAIPLKKYRELATYTPEKWFANQAGMEVGEELQDSYDSKVWWKFAHQDALDAHVQLEKQNVSKSIANRLLEPFAMVKGILTATDWDNLINLRSESGAQPDFQDLSTQLGYLLLDNDPVQVWWHKWHLPYIGLTEDYENKQNPRISAARCARVSYLNHDGLRDIEKDLDLSDMLEANKHLSPFEHPAIAIPGRHSNFSGWCQLRSFIYDNRKVDQSWRERLKKLKITSS